MNVLVVGGAGYIGSHCVRQLEAAGHRPVVLDNLVFGHRSAVGAEIPFYDCDLGDSEAVGTILREESIELVMHFAAFAYVGESVTEPRKYYENNFVATLRLLETMLDNGVKKFVFSSTCATYGEPDTLPMVETLPQAPINPYGQTKLDVENCLKAFAHAYGLSFAAFRYFNAAGAAEDGSIGEDHNPETHLIPLVIDAATGRREHIKIFGTDYDTPDGTCIRDYIHVSDLAEAHRLALVHLEKAGENLVVNLGSGKGSSILDITRAIARVTGRPVPCVHAPRRAGDPAELVAATAEAKRVLGFSTRHSDIETILRDAAPHFGLEVRHGVDA